jgi:prefoldin alpha subunit
MDAPLSEDERQQKIHEFETFINEKLNVDLDLVLQQRDSFYEELSKYLELKNTIFMIKDHQLKEMKTMINLGSEFYAQARIPDTSKIVVNVGLGFHVDYTLDEALKFIDAKEIHLNSHVARLSNKANDIRSKIQLMYSYLRQLMGVDTLTDEELVS